jgi:PPOX class probable F420-dependent enzyme
VIGAGDGGAEGGNVAAVLSDGLRKILDGKVFVTVATVQPDGSPQLSVVWAVRDGDDVLFSTTVDRRKARNLRRDPRVTLLVRPEDNPYAYAEIRGVAEVASDDSGELIDVISRKYTGKDYADFNPDAVNDAERVIVRVRPGKVIDNT